MWLVYSSTLEILRTERNVDDRVPVLDLTTDLTGFIYADKGYIKQNLFINLYERGLKMVHGKK
jgi:hypothetical protein